MAHYFYYLKVMDVKVHAEDCEGPDVVRLQWEEDERYCAIFSLLKVISKSLHKNQARKRG